MDCRIKFWMSNTMPILNHRQPAQQAMQVIWSWAAVGGISITSGGISMPLIFITNHARTTKQHHARHVLTESVRYKW